MASPSETTEMFIQLMENLTPVKDTVDGYRADATQRGYSPTAAEAMALDLHRALIATIFKTQEQQ